LLLRHFSRQFNSHFRNLVPCGAGVTFIHYVQVSRQMNRVDLEIPCATPDSLVISVATAGARLPSGCSLSSGVDSSCSKNGIHGKNHVRSAFFFKV
jgi:hypothetical protein